MNPKPIARDELPVYFGGESMPALRRVAKYDNGWLGSNLSPAENGEKIATLREMFIRNGRDPNQLRVMMMPGVAHFSPDHLGR